MLTIFFRIHFTQEVFSLLYQNYVTNTAGPYLDLAELKIAKTDYSDSWAPPAMCPRHKMYWFVSRSRVVGTACDTTQSLNTEACPWTG